MLTKQEMFNRAWNGLKSQGFERCVEQPRGVCVYDDGRGHRCAWGWVDPEGTATVQNMGVRSLARDKLGLAAELDEVDLTFAARLQLVHDGAAGPINMQERLRQFAKDWDLTVPE